MNRKLLHFGIIGTLLMTCFCGCKKAPVVEEVIPPDYNHITWQMDSVQSIPENLMEDGAFYVEHTDTDGRKTYYPLGTPTASDDMLYYLSGEEDIPTLFLGQGDRLVYHTYTGLLQDIYFSRIEDLGFTIGIYNIRGLENGRCVLTPDSDHILPLCKDAGILQEQEAETLLIDELGITLPSGYTFGEPAELTKTVQLKDNILSFYNGLDLEVTRNIENYDTTNFNPEAPDLKDIRYPKLTADTLNEGILYGLEKDQKYHLEFYSGTYYDAIDMTANIHMFTINGRFKEHFHTNQYKVRQSTLFEVEIPEIEDGLYLVGTRLGNGKTFRFIRKSEYSIEDTFDGKVFPKNIYGTTSQTNSKNQLNLVDVLEESSSVANMGAEYYNNAYFYYETEPDTEKYDNGISWYYRKDGVEIGRILNRHAEYFTQKEDAVFTTVLEFYDGRKIVRFFDCKTEDFVLPESTTDVFVETFEGGDYLFYTEAGLSLFPREKNTGIIALNHLLTSEQEILAEETPESDNSDEPFKEEVRYEDFETPTGDEYIEALIKEFFDKQQETTSKVEPDGEESFSGATDETQEPTSPDESGAETEETVE